MFATGTVCQICKEFPKSLKSNNNELEVGQYCFARHGELLAVLWHDHKDVGPGRLCRHNLKHKRYPKASGIIIGMIFEI